MSYGTIKTRAQHLEDERAEVATAAKGSLNGRGIRRCLRRCLTAYTAGMSVRELRTLWVKICRHPETGLFETVMAERFGRRPKSFDL